MHNRSLGARTIRAAALAAILSATFGTAALAQFGPPPPPGPPPPFGGPPGGPRFGGPGRGPRPSTAASVPLAALAAGLKLSGAQQAKVAQIQEQFSRQRRELMPPPPGGGPPDPGARRGAWDKMRALDQSADAGIAAVLSSPQKAALPALLRTLDDLRMEGIPPATYGTLKLSASQTARLIVLARTSQQATRQAVDAARRSGDFGPVRASMQSERERLASQAAALTPAQRSIVNSYKAARPRPPGGGPGGPGGFGPPPPPEKRGAQDEDHGRPIALVARDLGVSPAQFRAAFRKVHPAGAGQEPTFAERQANRRVLSERLGVSPERLDAVMDKYRPGGRGTNGPPPPDGGDQ